MSAELQKGEAVDLTRWAYMYRKGAADNPAETDWLWPLKDMTVIPTEGTESYGWYYTDAPEDPLRNTVLYGCLWEEPRHIAHVEVEFPAGSVVPEPEMLTVVGKPTNSMWSNFVSARHWWLNSTPEQMKRPLTRVDGPAVTAGGTTCFVFESDAASLQKFFVAYNGTAENVGIPVVRAYGRTQWAEPVTLDIRWGLQPEDAFRARNGRAETYNGRLDAIRPLDSGNGIAVAGGADWTEQPAATGRRGIRLTVTPTDGAVVTIRTDVERFSFAVADTRRKPVWIPALGVYITTAGSGLSAEQFREQLAARNLKTVRQRVSAHREQDADHAMKAFHGPDLPEFPKPAYQSGMSIDVPETLINAQWRLAAWHLTRWSPKQEDGTYCVSIWPAGKDDGGKEGYAALGGESYLIIRALDRLGLHEVAEGGLDYWIRGERAVPHVWYADRIGGGMLYNPYNSPNHRSPGYDQKHSGGHGRVLETVADHYRMTGNDAWLEQARPELEQACDWVIRLRKEWMKVLPRENPCYGLIPPGNTGDGSDTACSYFLSIIMAGGLREVADIFRAKGWDKDGHYSAEAEAFVRDIRTAAERSVARTAVVRIQDGTYRQYISWHPYRRTIGIERSTYTEEMKGGLAMVPSVVDFADPLTEEMLEVYEDVLLDCGSADAVAGQTDLPAGVEPWFDRDGYCTQNGLSLHPAIYLKKDFIPNYIRAVYNAYAGTIRPDKNYTFQECALKGKLTFEGADDKTFEEAAFVERIRAMLVWGEGNTLWLAKATPRAWLEQGKKISVAAAPTVFGTVGYTITSDVQNNRIEAVIEPPGRKPPEAILLRLRHPRKARILSVTVNGRAWDDFDQERKIIRLHGTGERPIRVMVVYDPSGHMGSSAE